MPSAKSQPQQPVIRVAPLGELNAYTVYEHERETLAQGSPSSLLLNFALALLPSAVGILVTLYSSTMSDLKITLFPSAAIIFIVAGLICLTLWARMHRSASRLVEQIKNRIPPPGTPATIPAPAAPPGAAAPAPPPAAGQPPATP